MLVLARQLNMHLDIEDFLCDYLHQHVPPDIRQFYENKYTAIQPLTCPLNMDDWQPNLSSFTDKQFIFEYALFCFTLILCAVDHLNHTNAIEVNDERKIPTSFDLMKLEDRDELINSKYDILLNEFLFQLGIWVAYLKLQGESIFHDKDPVLWDMCLLMYKLLREIWLETTKIYGDPISQMNKFTVAIWVRMTLSAK